MIKYAVRMRPQPSPSEKEGQFRRKRVTISSSFIICKPAGEQAGPMKGKDSGNNNYTVALVRSRPKTEISCRMHSI